MEGSTGDGPGAFHVSAQQGGNAHGGRSSTSIHPAGTADVVVVGVVVVGVTVVVGRVVGAGWVVAEAADVETADDEAVGARVSSSSPQAAMIANTPRSTSPEPFLQVCVTETGLGTRLSVTFGAQTSEASAGQKFAWAVMGPLGTKATKSALEQDLADIAGAVESTSRR